MNRKTGIRGVRRAAAAGIRVFSTQREHALQVWLFRPIAVAGALSLIAAPPVCANPKGGQVAVGTAVITQTGPSRLDIVQSTDRAAIDWQSFSIAPGEQTNFQQPAPSSMTLNRVAPGDPSVIAGRLTANGGVVLVNPSGITFSKGAVVDVNSLVATPTDISNANCMAGRMKFDKPSTDPRATVVNDGSITVAERGLAALVAPGVANSGVIQAKLGKVVLCGAQTYTIDLYGDGLISFDVGPKVAAVPTGSDGQPVKSLVSNTGRIDAPGGTVLLTADAVAGIIRNVVDAPGQINARASEQTPGSVMIDAGAAGAANVSGTIDVSGVNPRQMGGSATVTGGFVNLAGTARIDARGAAGGGKVRIGGGPHGQDGSVRNAQTTTVSAGALIDASAIANGNGGQVTVWSDQATQFAGTINALGSPLGGDGGWVETSSKGGLTVAPSAVVDASAPIGNAGVWLLDPANLTVTNSNSNITPAGGTGSFVQPIGNDATVDATVVSATLNAGTSVTLTTTNTSCGTCSQVGNLTVATGATIGWSSIRLMTLNADNAIVINGQINASGQGLINLNAGLGGIAINGSVATNLTFAPGGAPGIRLFSRGPITEGASGSINAQALEVLTQNDAGAAITLTRPAKAASNRAVLTALNSACNALAPGNISLADSTGL